MTEWVPIRYREFWDVPRIFLATYQGQTYLFDCPFDESVEDFPAHYRVFAMPALSDAELAGSWNDLSARAVGSAGDVAVADIVFDGTRRQAVDAAVFTRLGIASANGATTQRVVSGS